MDRHRTGKSVRVLDLVCSSILGRPGTTLPLRKDDIQVTDLEPGVRQHRHLSLSAAYESSSVLEVIVQKLGQDGRLDASTAHEFLQMLQEWAQALPQELRRQPATTFTPDSPAITRETTIGNIHVACTYYFGVILVTRQFLIQHIMPQLQIKIPTDSSHPGNGEGSHIGNSEDVEELAKLCTDAATYMAQMCCEASKTGYLLGNMCILKCDSPLAARLQN